MSDKIQFRRGTKAQLAAAVLSNGEPIFITDTKELVVGTGSSYETIHSNYDAVSAFRAYQSTTQSISAATFTKVNFQTEVYDNKSEFDATLSRFIALQSGIYLFSSCVQWQGQADGGLHQVVLYVNGSIYCKLAGGSAGGTGLAIDAGSAVLKLNAGDYVEIYCYTSTVQSTSGASSDTNFSAVRLA